MRAFKPALRQPLLRPSNLCARPSVNFLHQLRRRQHADHGPHKEYFQTPGQAPLPDTTPYQPGEQIQTTETSSEPSRLNRALRSIGWLLTFNVLGVAAGMALISWQYMQPPYPAGSPEEQEMLEDIEELMNNNPVAEDLREQGWVEEDFYQRRPRSTSDAGLNLIHEKLRGSSQTLSIKAFKNPSTGYTFILFFVGFGMDGFPDVMHGGITATMMLEAAAKHASNFHGDLNLVKEEPAITIDYKKPVRPGEVYTILLPPAAVEPMAHDPSKRVLRTIAFLLRLDMAPKMESHFNAVKGITEHTVEISSVTGMDPNLAYATVLTAIDDSKSETPSSESD